MASVTMNTGTEDKEFLELVMAIQIQFLI